MAEMQIGNGKYFDDLVEGAVYTTPARTIGESDINAFAGLSGDYNEVHTNEEFAKKTPWGTRIAHGLLTIAIGSGLQARLGIWDGTVLAALEQNWRFPAPVLIGDTIHVRLEIRGLKATSKPDRGIVDRHIEIVNQKGQVVAEGNCPILVKRRYRLDAEACAVREGSTGA